MSKYAIAGAYRNNCAFHCLANRIFSQDDNDIRKAFQQNPLYTQLMMVFYQYYDLGENYNVDNFISLMNKFPHPVDREILSGQVFRQVLRDKSQSDPNFKQFDLNELKDFNLVSDDLFAKFANLLGVNLTIHATEEPSVFDLNYPIKNELLKLDIFHTERGGGHYNFDYGDPLLDTIHNEQLQPPDQFGQIMPVGGSVLYEKSNIIGVKEQEAAIKKEVQLKYQEVLNSIKKNEPEKGIPITPLKRKDENQQVQQEIIEETIELKLPSRKVEKSNVQQETIEETINLSFQPKTIIEEALHKLNEWFSTKTFREQSFVKNDKEKVENELKKIQVMQLQSEKKEERLFDFLNNNKVNRASAYLLQKLTFKKDSTNKPRNY